MVYRGTCTGSDFCVSMTWDHPRDGYEAGCAPGVWWVESGPGMLQGHLKHTALHHREPPHDSAVVLRLKTSSHQFSEHVSSHHWSPTSPVISAGSKPCQPSWTQRTQSTNSREGSCLTNLLRQARNFQRLLSITIYMQIYRLYTYIHTYISLGHGHPQFHFLGTLFSNYTYIHTYVPIYISICIQNITQHMCNAIHLHI